MTVTIALDRQVGGLGFTYTDERPSHFAAPTLGTRAQYLWFHEAIENLVLRRARTDSGDVPWYIGEALDYGRYELRRGLGVGP